MESEGNDHAADLKGRPSLKELVLEDEGKKATSDAVEPYHENLGNKATTSSSFFGNVNYDSALIKNCISRISDINAKQVEREMKETARNRKVNNIGSYKNMTIG